MKVIAPLFATTLVIFIIDLYLYKLLWVLFKKRLRPKPFAILSVLHFIVPVITFFIYLNIKQSAADIKNPGTYLKIFNLFSVFILIYFPKLIVVICFFVDEIIFYLRRFFARRKVSRKFYFTFLGLVLGFIVTIIVAFGIFSEKGDYEVKRATIKFENLPKEFNNFRIVQISDLHLGTFGGNSEPVKKLVQKINSLKPDLVVFTGDMVNNFAEETYAHRNAIKGIKARFGMYSVLGNHDYGDYFTWKNDSDKAINLSKIKMFQKNAGFKLLLNENDSIVKGKSKIRIIGVENWGRPPFKQYGDIDKSVSGTNVNEFRILLSHDPDYWREVLKNHDIELTMSGHTHAMQFGIDMFGIWWSPAKWRFKEWGGLYEDKGRFIYVNIGAGYIGIPFRIGVPAEITELTLKTIN